MEILIFLLLVVVIGVVYRKTPGMERYDHRSDRRR
jgi:hypothetical protein